MVTWKLGRVEVDGRGHRILQKTPDSARGVEVEGNVEVTLVGTDGGGGKFFGIGPDGRGRTANGAFRTQMMTSVGLIVGGCPSIGLVLASKPRPIKR